MISVEEEDLNHSRGLETASNIYDGSSTGGQPDATRAGAARVEEWVERPGWRMKAPVEAKRQQVRSR